MRYVRKVHRKISMRQIETLVFDYGGVIVNIDDVAVVKAMESLGITAFKRLIHVRKIKRLMHQYINRKHRDMDGNESLTP